LESLLSINGTTDVDFSRSIVFAPRTENLCLADSNRGLDDLSPADYSNFVRTTLKKYISHKFTKGGATLIVYLLDPEIERRIRNTGALPLTDDEKTWLMEAISTEERETRLRETGFSLRRKYHKGKRNIKRRALFLLLSPCKPRAAARRRGWR
jgi:hypothetical protein